MLRGYEDEGNVDACDCWDGMFGAAVDGVAREEDVGSCTLCDFLRSITASRSAGHPEKALGRV